MSWTRNLNALWIIAYCAIITVAFGLQIFDNEEPCPLCYLQRIAMLLLCTLAAFNLLFGERLHHYSLAIITALIGAGIAARQISIHICPDSPHFGVPFWGLSLYTWSFFTFIGSLLLIALLIGFYGEQKETSLNRFQKVALVWLSLVILGNVISAFLMCGLGPCVG